MFIRAFLVFLDAMFFFFSFLSTYIQDLWMGSYDFEFYLLNSFALNIYFTYSCFSKRWFVLFIFFLNQNGEKWCLFFLHLLYIS
jgi:hypothetical protein